jgi:Ca2+-binding EF-hand superfamily protein
LDGIFERLDCNSDDKITREEMKLALEEFHGSEKNDKIRQWLETTFDSCDVNQDGVIDKSEFLAAAANDADVLSRRNLRRAFHAMDKTHTERITIEDFRAFFNDEIYKKHVMSKREAKKLMRQIDANGDGEIDFEEFCNIMLGELMDYC